VASQRSFFGALRLWLLLALLAFVALGAWLERRRSTDWDEPLRVTVYPVAAPGAAGAVADHLAQLGDPDFDAVETFLAEEAQAFGLALAEPVRVRVSHAAREAPPALPERPSRLGIAAWSLRLRWWAWRVQANDPLPPPDIKVFAVHHPADARGPLPDSLGLAKGLTAIAHLYADPLAAGSNQVVLTHELLHTLGATDKYDRRSLQPLAPDGLGDPDRRPRYPQEYAEIMAGRIALSANRAEIPTDLDQVTMGTATAREIGWLSR
jgi:hypothetical protein